jgi:hypothetical protein
MRAGAVTFAAAVLEVLVVNAGSASGCKASTDGRGPDVRKDPSSPAATSAATGAAGATASPSAAATQFPDIVDDEGMMGASKSGKILLPRPKGSASAAPSAAPAAP